MFVGGITEVGYKPPRKRAKYVLPKKNVKYTPTGGRRWKIWDNRRVIDEYFMSETRKLTVSLVARNGEKYLEFRYWYVILNEEEPRWIPTGSGVVLPLFVNRQGKAVRPMEGLAETVAKAMEQYEDMPIYEEGKDEWSTTNPKYKLHGKRRRRRKKSSL